MRGKTFCAPGEPASSTCCCGFSLLGKERGRGGNKLISIQLLIILGLVLLVGYVYCSVLLHGDGSKVMSRGIDPPGATV